jgi:hypothetical protein
MPLDQILDKFVVGRSFLTTYGNQRIYRIEEVDLKLTPMSKFPNERFKTFHEYFLKQYKVNIENKNQFLVVAKRRKKQMDKSGKKIEIIEDIHLVPELLRPTGMTDEMRADWKAMGAIGQHTQIPPHKRDKMQGSLAAQLNNTPNEIGLTIDAKSNTINDALLFTAPQIRMNKTMVPKGSGTWRIKEPVYAKNASLGKWAIIVDGRDMKCAEIVA